jgi:hypothetical protein
MKIGAKISGTRRMIFFGCPSRYDLMGRLPFEERRMSDIE